MSAVRVLVGGHVQGVGFRWAVEREAERLGVAGWVRNLADGRVEARFEGEDDAVEGVVAFCRRGPDTAQVESVDVCEVAPEGSQEFRVR
ncbi:MAG TPA: acylphosphatase [Thermoleophilaceae bacterium]|nr:acylphosphatase [Thermoleophilaceae bacterium]